MSTASTINHPNTNFVIAPGARDDAAMAAVSALGVPSTWEFRWAKDFVAAPAVEPAQAVVLVSALDGPMPSTKEAILRLVQMGVRDVAIALFHATLVDDEEILELIEMEVRELLSSYGFPGDTALVAIFRASDTEDPVAALWRELRQLIDVMSVPSPNVPTHPNSPRGQELVDSNSWSLTHSFDMSIAEDLDQASLLVIESAPGRRVRDGHAIAMAARVDGGWWAPEFQFVEGSRAVSADVIQISEDLGGREDTVGVLSWWLTTNAWLDGQRPCDLVGTGRTAELAFAASQVAAGNF